jgi:hypothetical protein
VKIHPRRHVVPGATEEIDTMSGRCYSAEDLAEVELRASGLRILIVLPVEYKYPH